MLEFIVKKTCQWCGERIVKGEDWSHVDLSRFNPPFKGYLHGQYCTIEFWKHIDGIMKTMSDHLF